MHILAQSSSVCTPLAGRRLARSVELYPRELTLRIRSCLLVIYKLLSCYQIGRAKVDRSESPVLGVVQSIDDNNLLLLLVLLYDWNCRRSFWSATVVEKAN